MKAELFSILDNTYDASFKIIILQFITILTAYILEEVQISIPFPISNSAVLKNYANIWKSFLSTPPRIIYVPKRISSRWIGFWTAFIYA